MGTCENHWPRDPLKICQAGEFCGPVQQETTMVSPPYPGGWGWRSGPEWTMILGFRLPPSDDSGREVHDPQGARRDC
jgi:hypothetical protein